MKRRAPAAVHSYKRAAKPSNKHLSPCTQRSLTAGYYPRVDTFVGKQLPLAHSLLFATQSNIQKRANVLLLGAEDNLPRPHRLVRGEVEVCEGVLARYCLCEPFRDDLVSLQTLSESLERIPTGKSAFSSSTPRRRLSHLLRFL